MYIVENLFKTLMGFKQVLYNGFWMFLRRGSKSFQVDHFLLATLDHFLIAICNPNLSTEWQTELGEDWQEIQAKYLHTPGNLTLTGYNSELSDRPFKTKQEVPGGFKDSPIRLNHGLARLEKWSEAEIHHRGQELAEIASKVWPYTTLSLEDAKKHCKSSTSTSGLKEQGYEADTDSETEEMGVYAL